MKAAKQGKDVAYGDLWLIDFGGGWTDGWVDQDKQGTMEGDDQAVRKIVEALCL